MKMYPNDSRFWQYMVYADIRGGSLEMGRQTTVGLPKTAIFGDFDGYSFGNFGDESNIII